MRRPFLPIALTFGLALVSTAAPSGARCEEFDDLLQQLDSQILADDDPAAIATIDQLHRTRYQGSFPSSSPEGFKIIKGLDAVAATLKELLAYQESFARYEGYVKDGVPNDVSELKNSQQRVLEQWNKTNMPLHLSQPAIDHVQHRVDAIEGALASLGSKQSNQRRAQAEKAAREAAALEVAKAAERKAREEQIARDKAAFEAARVESEKRDAAFNAIAGHVLRPGYVCADEQVYRDVWNDLTGGNLRPIYGLQRESSCKFVEPAMRARVLGESEDGRLYHFEYRVPYVGGTREGWALKNFLVPLADWKKSRL